MVLQPPRVQHLDAEWEAMGTDWGLNPSLPVHWKAGYGIYIFKHFQDQIA